MSLLVLADAQKRPKVFRWSGPIPRDDLRAWLGGITYPIPDDLIELWATVGGGELFESEELYAPDGSEDDLRVASAYLIECGLPRSLTVFHRGICVSVIDQSTGELVALGESAFQELDRFRTFDEWYRRLPRAEFAERYGLGDPDWWETPRAPGIWRFRALPYRPLLQR